LAQLERIFFERQMRALEQDRPDMISFSLGDYRQVCEALRKFEREIELARRDPGQLISKQAAQEGVQAVARFLRLAWRRWISANLPDLVAQKDVLSAKAFAERTFSETVKLTMKRWHSIGTAGSRMGTGRHRKRVQDRVKLPWPRQAFLCAGSFPVWRGL
jgi:hypothetical protein